MIPLITHTPRLTLLATSRALLTAELQKPQYFSTLLGAALPPGWPPALPEREAALARTLGLLTAGGRDAAGWYDWYALRKADADAPRTLIGTAAFLGPPDAAGRAEITAYLVPEWRGQGLGTELVAGLVQQAAATGQVRLLVAHTPPEDLIPQRTLLANGFASTGTDVGGRLRFERAVEPAAALPAG